MSLRPYQQEAVNCAVEHMRRSVMPGLLELATGAGKSHIVAAVAQWVYESTGKRVLCLQPSKELTQQNHEKYLATGNPASIFSASAGGKCMRHPIVYGTPGTVKNSLSRFGDQFGAVIIDEAHGITETIKAIVCAMQQKNPRLRVLGMTATPYRTNTGYIYQYDVDGSFVPETQAREPWFNTLLYRIQTRGLIDMGFLTPAHADPDHAASYEAGNLQLNSRGQFDAADLERVFEGRGRLTSEIVADVVAHAHGRRGVMLFAATVQHAKEIMESLPPGNARMLGGDVNMGKSDREKLIDDFKAQRYKYVVSVATLTTGFDAPHVDLIAVLRATESPGLLQQIIGRGLRLFDGKEDCIAEGQKVLTDQGLVNIEDVRLCHKLWDGVEWVSHDGVICKGEREVITHDGLTATEDHKCWTESGWKTLGLLQQAGETLTKTGNGGQAIKLIDNSGREDPKDRRSTKSLYADPVHELRGGEREVFIESSQRNGGVPKVRKEKALRKAMPWRSTMASSKMHICKTEVHERKRPELPELWRQGDNIRLQDPIRNGPMDYGQHPQLVEGFTNRQDRQQQGVCPWEYQDGSARNKHEQPEGKLCNTNGPCVHGGESLCELRSEHAYSKDMGRNELRGNTKTVGSPVFKTKRRVWDIVNAGPRNRFTCQGRLVSNCLVLDYAENIERHRLYDDLFAPRIRVKGAPGESEPVNVNCPECGFRNEFSPRKNDEGFDYSEDGYFLDLNGQPIETDHGPMPSHHGRRCTGQVRAGIGLYERCEYRWTSKECPECQADNDIAARHCCACKCEIVDPNERLRREFVRVKKDPYSVSTDPVLSWTMTPGVSQSGNDTLRIDYTTEYRTFAIWYTPGVASTNAVAAWEALSRAVYRGHVAPTIDMFLEHINKGAMPTTITYAKQRGKEFYRVVAYNRPADRMPEA